MKPLSRIALAAGLIAPGLLASAARAEDTARAPSPAPPGQASPASQSKTPAASEQPAEDPRDRKIRELEDLVANLAKRVNDLEQRPTPPAAGSVQLKQQPPPPGEPPGPQPVPPGQPPGPQPVPPGEPPGPMPVPPGGEQPGPVPVPPGGEQPGPLAVPPGTEAPGGQPSSSATLLPNISVIGDVQFHGGTAPVVENAGHLSLEELEIAFQDAVSPGLRYDAFITAGRPDFGLSIEEAYITASRLGPGWTGHAGVMHVPFGRFNPTHAHAWPFITEPSVIRAFLSPGQLIADGGVVEKQFSLPWRKIYAQGQLGVWRTALNVDDRYGFRGGAEGALSSRFWFGGQVGKQKDVEIGFSHYQGRGSVIQDGRRMLSLEGIDAAYRSFPASSQRIWLQGEFIVHNTWLDGDPKARFGAYFFGAYKWSDFYEMGGRLDWTQYPYDFSGTETAGSLWITKFLTEQTSLRAQYTHAVSPIIGSNDQIFLQLLFGSGPHSHNIQ